MPAVAVPHAVPTMPRPSTLQQFIDDELERAPLLLREVIAATLDELRGGEGPSLQQRRQQFELQRPLAQHAPLLVTSFVQALREQVVTKAPQGSGSAAQALDSLALVEEVDVAADVEVARAIEAIKALAEAELRDLRRYTAALAGDVDVARDSNPFNPEVIARCLWTAMQTLPLPRGSQIALLHHAAMPLAQTLRAGYAAASQRLERQGVEPAAYRTVILPPGSRRYRPNADRHELSSDMNRLRETMPAPFLDVDLAIPEPDPVESRPAPAASPVTTVAQAQLKALVQRLFEAMLADPALPLGLHGLISGLQPPILQLALREPGVIDNESHAAWRFVDRLAFAAEVPLFEPEGLGRMLRVAQGLVEHIARAPLHDEALFRWGEDRLAALEQHTLQQRRSQAALAIGSLQQLEATLDGDADARRPIGAQALDAGSLDTVPASLLDLASIDAAAKSGRATQWLEARRAGDVLRIFMQGHWTGAQVIWQSDLGGVWLINALPGGPSWALRRSALDRLWTEGLVDVMSPRSLVHDAAETVLKELDRPLQGSGGSL